MQVKDIMTKEVLTVHPRDTVWRAAQLMAESDHGGLPVVDEGNRVLGIITETDLLHFTLPKYIEDLGDVGFLPEDFEPFERRMEWSVEARVSEVMTKNVITVTEETSVVQVATLMLSRRVHRFPVVREGRLVGIVSRGDIVDEIVYQGLAELLGLEAS